MALDNPGKSLLFELILRDFWFFDIGLPDHDQIKYADAIGDLPDFLGLLRASLLLFDPHEHIRGRNRLFLLDLGVWRSIREAYLLSFLDILAGPLEPI